MPEQLVRLARLLPSRYQLVGLLIVLLLMGVVPAPLDAAREGKTEILPSQKPVPPAVAIESAGPEADLRRQLRTKNGVAGLDATTARIRFSQAPTNTFGFIPPQSLGMILVTQTPDLALDRTPPSPNAFEIHKLADGSGMVVGFVAAELVPQLTPVLRPKSVRITLHSNPTTKADRIVAVPLVKLASDRMPAWVDRKNPDSVVTLEMDLLGTVARKSGPGAQ